MYANLSVMYRITVMYRMMEAKSLVLEGLDMRIFAACIKLFNLVRILLANLIRCHRQNLLAFFMRPGINLLLEFLEAKFQFWNLPCHDLFRTTLLAW